jgi:hypothetical protein
LIAGKPIISSHIRVGSDLHRGSPDPKRQNPPIL